MERFEIALSINEEQLLIPSMLPKEKPGLQLHKLQKLMAKRKKSNEQVWLNYSRSSPSQYLNLSKSMYSYNISDLLLYVTDQQGRFSSSRGSSSLDNSNINTVCRNYQMAYTPSGFWSRLITRLIVSVQRWRTIEQIKEESYSLVYWREGIGVVYEGGYFKVESYQELVRDFLYRMILVLHDFSFL